MTGPGFVESVILDVEGLPISGIAALQRTRPRALLVGLPGGGLTSAYFHGQRHPEVSLLALAKEFGYAAVSIDRPGYGASAHALPRGLHIEQQAEVMWSVVDAVLSRFDLDVPVLLVGQSFGMKVSLHMAAASDREDLIGVDCSGAGVRYNPELPSHPGRPGNGSVALSPSQRIALFWGPEHLYPPGTTDRAHRPTAPVPASEALDSASWPSHFTRIAADVRAPVRYTVAEHERWWDVRPSTLEEFRAMLASAPTVEICHQRFAGHNISLGWAARAYHLKVLGFAEDCLNRLGRAGSEDGSAIVPAVSRNLR
jgi:pimeloyl-ACP methyl ester carboxylesterase